MSNINFHPFRSNVIDYVGQPLICTSTGEQVMVEQNMRGQFMVYVAGKLTESELDNLAASSVLNKIGCQVEQIEVQP